MKKIYAVVMVLILGMLGGCANIKSAAEVSIGSMKYGQALTKDDTGIIYGAAMEIDGSGADAVKSVCDANKNIDSRCAHQDDYILGFAVPACGFNAGRAQIATLIPKDAKVKVCRPIHSFTGCTYIKVKAEQGKIASFIEVASTPDETKCEWSGLINVGGVVCPTYNWDYRKNLRDYSTFFQVLPGVDK